MGLAVMLLLALVFNAPAQAAPDAVRCSAFEDLVLGTTYTPVTSFTSNGSKFNVTGPGFAQVENGGKAAGAGNEIEVNNVSLALDFAASGFPSADALAFRFGEYGGSLSLRVNGTLVNFNNFADIDGSVIGGVAVSVINGFGNDAGSVTLLGAINDWMVFGQELWIDDLCLFKEPVNPNDPYDPQQPQARPDLGDAPDSSNHVGIGNTAYPTAAVAGRFPTVWQGTPVGAGTGPKHLNAKIEGYLGNRFTPERDADPPAVDFDGLNNILAGSVDNANNDRFDDGWRNPGVPMPNCRETTLVVRVSRGVSSTVPGMHLNVWFDGNRDGDWEDRGQCQNGQAAGPVGISNEWIVRNFAVNMAAILPGGFADISVNTVLVLNNAEDQLHWVRFTLSERPAVNPPGAGSQPDGRGPDFPNAFSFGETEDYLRRPQPQGAPGTLTIEKQASASAIKAGERMTYTVRIAHVGGDAPAQTVMTDILPAGLTLAGPVRVREENPQVSPLLAQSNQQGMRWNGSLSPGGKVAIEIPVRAERCLGQPVVVRNTAYARQTDGSQISASVDLTVECPSAPSVEVVKRILLAGENGPQEVLEADILPGGETVYRFKATNNGALPVVVHLRDRLPEGIGLVIDGNVQHVYETTFRLSPNETAMRDLPVRLVRETGEKDLVNIGRYLGCVADLPSAVICAWPHDNDPVIRATNPVTLHVKGYDLGDAPDDSNHLGVAMTAYPAVAARFPTVYQPAALPVGPTHLNVQPFHLGPLVSREVNADIGADVDGVNNIEPAINVANRDRHDDGLNPATLAFADCAKSDIPVRVFIDPAAIAMLPQGTGYLNIWLDGKRDGDWDDIHECQVVGQAPFTAFEHIVIDFPVNAAALGAGLHTISVPTTQAVYWPTADAAKPAWLRATLSDAPSVKPFSAGAISYGDGRGPIPPFRLGETEDFLWREKQVPNGPDLAVRKVGRISDELDADGVRKLYWHVRVTNVGDAVATNVVLTDDLALAGSLVHLDWDGDFFPAGSSSFLRDGNKLIFTSPTWEPGQTALLTVETSLQPGAMVYTNTVKVVADSDIFTDNNQDRAVVVNGLRSPMILEPGNGTICENDVTVKGRSAAGAEIDLYVDGALAATTVADGEGRWSAAITLADGDHALYAIARKDGASSPPSPTIAVTVDSSLTWSPLSLRFTDSHGRSHRPVDEDGRTDVGGWQIRLRPGETYTVSVKVCCTEANATVSLLVSATLTVEMSDPDGDAVYSGVFTANGPRHSSGDFTLSVQCGANQTQASGEVLIDPEGVVFDVKSGAALAGATVACQQAQSLIAADGSASTTFDLWPAADYGQVNPQSTLGDGYFSFFTPVGSYRLRVNRSGYQAYRSTDIEVVSEAVRYDVPLTPQIADAAHTVISISEVGFSPAYLEVQPGAVVEWVNLDTVGHTATSKNAQTAEVAANGVNWDSGLLLTGERYKFSLTAEGAFSVVDSANPANTATIVVKQAPAATNAIFLPMITR